MARCVRWWLLFGLLASFPAFGSTDVFWLKLEARLSYDDPMNRCLLDWHMAGYVFFVGRVDDGKLTAGYLNEWRRGFGLPGIDVVLTRSEVASITLQKDSRGRYWLKRFAMGGQSLLWALANLDTHHDYPTNHGCPPPRIASKLSTVRPDPVLFMFETDDIEVVAVSYSNQQEVQGERWDGHRYRVGLRLRQTQR